MTDRERIDYLNNNLYFFDLSCNHNGHFFVSNRLEIKQFDNLRDAIEWHRDESIKQAEERITDYRNRAE